MQTPQLVTQVLESGERGAGVRDQRQHRLALQARGQAHRLRLPGRGRADRARRGRPDRGFRAPERRDAVLRLVDGRRGAGAAGRRRQVLEPHRPRAAQGQPAARRPQAAGARLRRVPGRTAPTSSSRWPTSSAASGASERATTSGGRSGAAGSGGAPAVVSGSSLHGGGLVLGVAVLVLLVLVGYPLLWLLLGALGLPNEVGLEHFLRVYSRTQNFEPLKNTLVLALGTGLLSVVLGVPLAWAAARSNVPLRRSIHALVALSYVTPALPHRARLHHPAGARCRLLQPRAALGAGTGERAVQRVQHGRDHLRHRHPRLRLHLFSDLHRAAGGRCRARGIRPGAGRRPLDGDPAHHAAARGARDHRRRAARGGQFDGAVRAAGVPRPARADRLPADPDLRAARQLPAALGRRLGALADPGAADGRGARRAARLARAPLVRHGQRPRGAHPAHAARRGALAAARLLPAGGVLQRGRAGRGADGRGLQQELDRAAHPRQPDARPLPLGAVRRSDRGARHRQQLRARDRRRADHDAARPCDRLYRPAHPAAWPAPPGLSRDPAARPARHGDGGRHPFGLHPAAARALRHDLDPARRLRRALRAARGAQRQRHAPAVRSRARGGGAHHGCHLAADHPPRAAADRPPRPDRRLPLGLHPGAQRAQRDDPALHRRHRDDRGRDLPAQRSRPARGRGGARGLHAGGDPRGEPACSTGWPAATAQGSRPTSRCPRRAQWRTSSSRG